ncbi:hypothetical protein ACFWIQ_19450 [Kitasatospora sp. NPDC127059]|uniref:hypothetical protein n=1 Tax=unclassified Kitasatospora TaxID=2633591 RepID=UPI003647A05F
MLLQYGDTRPVKVDWELGGRRLATVCGLLTPHGRELNTGKDAVRPLAGRALGCFVDPDGHSMVVCLGADGNDVAAPVYGVL